VVRVELREARPPTDVAPVKQGDAGRVRFCQTNAQHPKAKSTSIEPVELGTIATIPEFRTSAHAFWAVNEFTSIMDSSLFKFKALHTRLFLRKRIPHA
jgi:hypothetical protein